MATVLTTLAFESVSGKPEDRFVNNWVCTTPTAGFVEAEWFQFVADLDLFYNAVDPGTNRSIANLMGTQISRAFSVHTASAYLIDGHLDGSDHGSPVSRQAFHLLGATAGMTNLPSEMAICLSFHAAYANDPEFQGLARPRARDRGRVFLGPMNNGGMSQDANNVPIIGIAYRDTIEAAAVALMNRPNHAWSVWSRKNAAVEPVVGGWIDDAWDIQRRRGEAARTRTTWGQNA